MSFIRVAVAELRAFEVVVGVDVGVDVDDVVRLVDAEPVTTSLRASVIEVEVNEAATVVVPTLLNELFEVELAAAVEAEAAEVVVVTFKAVDELLVLLLLVDDTTMEAITDSVVGNNVTTPSSLGF